MRTAGIIVLSTVLGLGLVVAMVVVTRFLWGHRDGGNKENDGGEGGSAISVGSVKKQSLNSWTRVLGKKEERNTRGEWVPTLGGIIKAGDEGVYDSSLFNSFTANNGDIRLQDVYDAFAAELRTRPNTERAAYPSEISRFILSMRRDRRRASIDFSEKGLGRSKSKKSVPVLVSLNCGSGQGRLVHGLWTQDLQHAQRLDGRTSVTVTASELVSLSLILGAPVKLHSKAKSSEKAAGVADGQPGAYGISISSVLANNGNYQVSLNQKKRRALQMPAKGSGYSILLAKHIACGSLPMSASTKTTDSILITNETLEAVQSGCPLQLQRETPGSKSAVLLSSLSNSDDPVFHTLVPSTSTVSSASELLHSISDLPFTGGFVPLASKPLINTIRFVASGGLVPGRLLQRLEALVDKVHTHSPALQLFGPIFETNNAASLFRERERLGRVATGVVNEETVANKVARMQRYVTLIERLMLLSRTMGPRDVVSAVREEVKTQIERAYEDAVAAHRNSGTASIDTPPSRRKHRSKRSSTASIPTFTTTISSPTSTVYSPTSSFPITSPTALFSPRASSTFPPHNLGKLVEGLLKQELPFDIQSVALVVRMVIVAWTLSVESTSFDDVEEGFRVPSLEGMLGKMMLV